MSSNGSLRWTILLFLLISIPAFLLWRSYIRDPYLEFIAETFASMARSFGQEIYLIDNHTGELFFRYGQQSWSNEFGVTAINLVALVSLVLATQAVNWRRKVRWLLIGTVFLMSTHVLGLWCDVWGFNTREDPRLYTLVRAVRALVTGLGTFLFPLLIWLCLVREQLAAGAFRRPAD